MSSLDISYSFVMVIVPVLDVIAFCDESSEKKLALPSAMLDLRFSVLNSEEKLRSLKKSGKMVARRGRREGKEAVMMMRPTSMVDQVKYGMVASVEVDC